MSDALDGLTREQTIDRLRATRELRHAEDFLVDFSLASEAHPEILRAALAAVFDLSAVDSAAKRAVLIATEAQQQAKDITDQARWMLDDVAKEATRIRAEVEGLEYRLQRAAEAFARLRSTYASTRQPAGAA